MRVSSKLLILPLCVAIFIGCSDKSSTGPDPEEAPSIPQLQSEAAQPDVSYFQNNQPKAGNGALQSETTNFYSAKAVATTMTIGQLMFYDTFIEAARNQDPSYDGDMWNWEYSYTFEGATVAMKLTAENVGDKTNWALYWTVDSEEMSFTDYKVMEGTANNDGTEGNWTFNSLNPDTNEETPAIVYKYTVSSETQKTITANYFDETGSSIGTMDYDENQPDYLLTITDPTTDGITIYWNTDTKEGYFQEGTEKRCWDSNFEDTPCS